MPAWPGSLGRQILTLRVSPRAVSSTSSAIFSGRPLRRLTSPTTTFLSRVRPIMTPTLQSPSTVPLRSHAHPDDHVILSGPNVHPVRGKELAFVWRRLLLVKRRPITGEGIGSDASEDR